VYALPRRLRDLGIRRFGFHGLSVQWAAERVHVLRLVVCHLGGGCSVTAVSGGVSVYTTMGFTPLDGVPMATRSGSVDPGAITYLLRRGLIDVEELDHILEQESGLLGLSGIAGSVRALEESDDPAAGFALEVFVRHVAAAVAAAVTTLGGLDALVFTGGVGEHSASVRAGVAAKVAFLGVHLDPEANACAEPDAEIGARDAAVRVVVVRTREELVIARETRRVIG
jgi:acetate kinase